MRLSSFALAAAAATTLAALAVPASPLGAQEYPEGVARSLADCRNQSDDDRERLCEVRTVAVARGTRALDIDASTNGGIRVTAWDRDSIAVHALVQTWGEDAAEAREIAQGVRVAASAGRIRTEASPSTRRRTGYAVSYHVFAPRGTDIDARSGNGGITIDGIAGRVDVQARNGGIAIRNAGGDVRGRTTNGGITLALAGSRWNGRGVELETTNGSVTVTVPDDFNADLEASTVNGAFDIDFPVTLQGRIDRRLTTKIGNGGPLVRVATTNGPVRIRRG